MRGRNRAGDPKVSIIKTVGIVGAAFFLAASFGSLYGNQTTGKERILEKTVPEVHIAALPTPKPEKQEESAPRKKNEQAPRKLIIRQHVVAPRPTATVQDTSGYFVH